MRAAGLAFFVVLGATGCGLVAGLSDYGAAEGDGAGGAGQGGGGLPSCDGGTCYPPAPDGWDGPVAIAWREEDAEACPSSWGVDQGPLHTDLGEPACSACVCEDIDVECGPPMVSTYDDPGCAGTATGSFSIPVNCNLLPTSGQSNYHVEAPPVPVTGQCVGDPMPALIEGEAVGRRARQCATEADLPGTCPGDLACLPDLPAGYQLCVWRDGNAGSCPASFPFPESAYRLVEDQRDCGLCSCTFPQTATCEGAVLIGTEGTCDASTELPFDGTCSAAGAWTHFTIAPLGVQPPMGLSCTASGGEPSGAVVGDQPVTLCCR